MTSPQSGSARAVQPSLAELRAEAAAWARKPRRFGTWYVTQHMLAAMRKYGWTIVVGGVGQPLVYLLGLAAGLAALIQVPISSHGEEVAYLDFVAPALLVSATISVATEELTYPVMAGFKWRRFFYGFNASALSSPQIANGVIVAAAGRMLFTGAAYYLLVWIFGAIQNPETGWITILLGVVGGLAFGIPLAAYAASIEDDRGQFALVQRFIFMPMFLFSGTFYPLETLPVWLQWIGWISPLWHSAELGRAASFGADVGGGMIALHCAYLTLLIVLGYVWARRVFIRRLAA